MIALLSLLILLLLLLVSLLLMWKGSDWLTDSIIPVAERIGTSYIAVTTLLVAFLLSVPEIVISLYSSLLGHVHLGLGVIIGSVMANIGLTVGLSAAYRPLLVEKSVVIRDGVYLVIVALIVLLFGADLQYSRVEGGVLLLLFIPYAFNVFYFEKLRSKHQRRQRVKSVTRMLKLSGFFPRLKLRTSPLTFVLGGAVLLLGSYLFSVSLIRLNAMMHFPELLVGLTLGALGPAIPNIAAALQGTRQGYSDAAITETFGSNIFTLLFTLGLIVLVSPLSIAGSVFYFDLTWMIVLTLLMIAFIFKGYHYREASLTRYEGAVLVVLYLTLLVLHVIGGF